MEPFTTLTGIAAPLPLENVDTDMIIPKQFLRTIKRTGLGENLFNDMRYDQNGQDNPDFVLNQPPYRKAQIIIGGKNFGCGSSREHAPWSLLDFGIRCILAPSFADIFFNNCFKNGILPIVLKEKSLDTLMGQALAGHEITIDLEKQIISSPDQSDIAFDIEPFRKHCLLNGLDDISLTLEKEEAITCFEEKRGQERPWL